MTFRASKIRSILWGLLCLAIAGFGVYMLGLQAESDDVARLYAAIVFFGLGGLALLVITIFFSPTLHIDETGIRYSRWGATRIPWSGIKAIKYMDMKTQKFFSAASGLASLASGRSIRLRSPKIAAIMIEFSDTFDIGGQVSKNAQREIKLNALVNLEGLSILENLFEGRLDDIYASLQTFAPKKVKFSPGKTSADDPKNFHEISAEAPQGLTPKPVLTPAPPLPATEPVMQSGASSPQPEEIWWRHAAQKFGARLAAAPPLPEGAHYGKSKRSK